MSRSSDLFWRLVVLLSGPAAFTALALWAELGALEVPRYGLRPYWAAGIFAWMALWWLTEAVPIWVTSLLPLLLYPAVGLSGAGPGQDLAVAALPFTDAYIFLFMGGMALGASMEQWNLHRRLALHILLAIGTRPSRLLLGVLVATATVSMWISNTATAVMMLPIAMALVAQLEVTAQRRLNHFGGAIMLAVAYAANVGGVGTKIGTTPNSVFAGFLTEKLGYDLGFLEYMVFGTPVVVLFIPIVWGVLWREGRKDLPLEEEAGDVIRSELRALGPMSSREKWVAVVFVAAATLWILGDLIRPWISPFVPSFWDGYRFAGKHYEAAVAMAVFALLVATRTLSWAKLKEVPWSVLILLGGSFALASGMENSGLSVWMSERLKFASNLGLFGQFAVAATTTILMSAIASNVASTNVMLNVLPPTLPVLAVTTMAASFDFALPAGTPPNAIVFGSGYVRLPVMMKVGVMLDLIAAVFLTVYGYVWVARVFG